MTTKTKKHVYRIGDTIRIITPEFFVRCGYPMDVQVEALRIMREHGDDVNDLLMKLAGVPPVDRSRMSYQVALTDTATPSKLDRELAYLVCRSKGFGGNTRRIYTERKEEFVGETFYVIDKKVVTTGVREAGGYSGGYDGPEYEPPVLCNEKKHVVLAVNKGKYVFDDPWDSALKIEAAHVEPVQTPSR